MNPTEVYLVFETFAREEGDRLSALYFSAAQANAEAEALAKFHAGETGTVHKSHRPCGLAHYSVIPTPGVVSVFISVEKATEGRIQF